MKNRLDSNTDFKKKMTSKNNLKEISLWVLGLLFMVAGIGAYNTSVLASGLYFLASFIIIPTSFKTIQKKLNVDITSPIRWFLVLLLFFSASYFLPLEIDKTPKNDDSLEAFMKAIKDSPKVEENKTIIRYDDCWDFGFKFGYCGTLSAHGVKCAPQDDVIIPGQCRNKSETNMGIRSGTARAFERLGLPR